MNFREMLSDDLSQVILDPTEFGSEVTWNGEPVRAKVSELAGEVEHEPGVYVSEMEILLAVAQVALPKPGQEIDLDGVKWLVRSASVKGSALTVVLYRNLS